MQVADGWYDNVLIIEVLLPDLFSIECAKADVFGAVVMQCL